MTIKRGSAARRFLEEAVGPLTLGSLLVAVREGEGWSQAEMARTLGVSRSYLRDVEKGRRGVSPARAVELARSLHYSEKQFVRLALQGLVDEAGIDLRVDVA